MNDLSGNLENVIPVFGRGRRVAALLLPIALATAPAWAEERTESSAARERLLLGADYPIEVSVSFHNGLLHWLDSLTTLAGAGYTGGKTIPAHRAQYTRAFGTPTPVDRNMLTKYHAVRHGWVRAADDGERDRLTLAFFTATDLDDALERAAELLEAPVARALDAAMRHFAPRYHEVWRDGRVPRGFVSRTESSNRRGELASLLVQVARFFDVAPDTEPRPHLVLVPVPAGHGTHAQAIGPFLLIEIRPGESLADEAAPIVHENTHFLFYRIPPSRLAKLERAASAIDPRGSTAWQTLKEALPTAIAQGVADKAFRRKTWSMRRDWYHTRPVDDYAKRIFPLVRNALRDGTRFDEEFVRQLVEAHE